MLHASTIRGLGALAISLAVITSAGADTIYGITYNGKLLSIDTTTAVGTTVRVLPEPYREVQSLLYVDGVFYAGYQGGNVVRFALDADSEIALGPSGYTYIGDLALDTDGVVYASVASDGGDWATGVGRLDLLSGVVTDVKETGDSGLAYDMDAIACAGDGTLWVANRTQPSDIARFDPDTGAISEASTRMGIGEFTGMESAGGNDFWGVTYPTIHSFTSSLVQIDTTGAMSYVGTIANEYVTAIALPEPSAVLLLGAGALAVLRRRVA